MISATRLSRQIYMSPLSLLLIFIFFLQGKIGIHKIIRPTCSSPLSVFIDASLILSPLSCRSPDLFHKCPHISQPSAPIFRSIGNTALSMAPRRRDDDGSRKKQISKKRREQLGIIEGEDEYDLDYALDNNTDPFITKIIAGSFILAILALLVFGVIVPNYLTDYGEGVCNPIRNAGRC